MAKYVIIHYLVICHGTDKFNIFLVQSGIELNSFCLCPTSHVSYLFPTVD